MSVQKTDLTAWSDPGFEDKGGSERQTEPAADRLAPMSVLHNFSLLFVMVLIAIGVTSAWYVMRTSEPVRASKHARALTRISWPATLHASYTSRNHTRNNVAHCAGAVGGIYWMLMK